MNYLILDFRRYEQLKVTPGWHAILTRLDLVAFRMPGPGSKYYTIVKNRYDGKTGQIVTDYQLTHTLELLKDAWNKAQTVTTQ